MANKIPNEFQIQLIGEPQSVSPVLSKMRARIFYKYDNRNGAYITDEFAEKLLNSIPYTPIKGIYSLNGEDFTEHGKARDLGRIYGVVPEQYNLAWEPHQDDDGIERIYATVDVYIYTVLYKEAQQIKDKSLSMEIYRDSIKGKWKRFGGREYFEYSDGCFLGLQVLGDSVEPCFEGAGFFTLKDQISEIIEQYTKQKKAGGTKMDFNIFELSNAELGKILFDLLNTGDKKFCIFNVDEEKNICLAYDLMDKICVEVPFEKQENETYTLGEPTTLCAALYAQTEYEALNALKDANEGTFEKINENFVKKIDFDSKVEEFNSKIVELETANSSLLQEKEELTTQYTAVVSDLARVKEEKDSLRSYKLSIESAQKNSIIDKYAALLPQETIEEFKNSLDTYSLVDLEKELAFSYMKTGAAFTQKENYTLIPKAEPQKSGIEAILDNYEKRN